MIYLLQLHFLQMRKLNSEQFCDFPKIFLLLAKLELESRPPNSNLALILLRILHHISKLIPFIQEVYLHNLNMTEKSGIYIIKHLQCIFFRKSILVFYDFQSTVLILLPFACLCFTDTWVCVCFTDWRFMATLHWYWCLFSNSIHLLQVSVWHFSNFHNILCFFVTVIFVMVICDQ